MGHCESCEVLLLVVVVIVTQTCTCISLLFTYLVSAVEALQGSAKMLYIATKHETDIARFAVNYKACQLIFEANTEMYGNMIAILMAFGFTLVVGCTVATLTVQLMTLRFYWMFPIINVVVIVFIAGTLPFAVQVHEKTVLVLQRVKERFAGNLGTPVLFRNGFQNRYDKRLCVALRPIQLKCGQFFGLRLETKIDYYWGILDWTINALLST